MDYDINELSHLFKERLEQDPYYPLALNLVKELTVGPSYLVGGTVYKGLINALHKFEYHSKDYDFLVSNITTLNTPADWTLGKTRFGSPKFQKDDVVVDLIPLNNVLAAKLDGLPGTLESYFKTVPLSIHAIAYDVQTEQLIGDIGIRSILSRTIFVLNQKYYKMCEEVYGKEKYSVESTARKFDFKIM